MESRGASFRVKSRSVSFDVNALSFAEAQSPLAILRIGITNWVSTLTAVFLLMIGETDFQTKSRLTPIINKLAPLVVYLNLSLNDAVDLQVTPNPAEFADCKIRAQRLADEAYYILTESTLYDSEEIEFYVQLFDRLNLYLSSKDSTQFWIL